MTAAFGVRIPTRLWPSIRAAARDHEKRAVMESLLYAALCAAAVALIEAIVWDLYRQWRTPALPG